MGIESAYSAYTRFLELTGDPTAAAILAVGVSRDAETTTDTLKPGDVAKQLSVSPATVIGWIRSGQLKAANIAKGPRPRYVIRPSDLDAFLKMRQPEPPAKRGRQAANRSDDRY